MAPTPTPTTIELTAKRWKALKLVGVVLLVIAVVLFVAGLGEASTTTTGQAAGAGLTTAAVLLGLLGMGIWITARLLAWWHHG